MTERGKHEVCILAVVLGCTEQAGSNTRVTSPKAQCISQHARRVLKGHILTGSLIDFWLNPAMYDAVELPERFFKNTETPGSHYACTGRQGKLGTGNLGKETEIFLPFCFLSNPPGKH